MGFAIVFKTTHTPVNTISTNPDIHTTINTVTNNNINITIHNKSNIRYEFSEYYELHIYKYNGWHKMPYIVDTYVLHDVLHTIHPNRVEVIQYDFWKLYGSLNPGKYRLFIEDIYVEFTIN